MDWLSTSANRLCKLAHQEFDSFGQRVAFGRVQHGGTNDMEKTIDGAWRLLKYGYHEECHDNEDMMLRASPTHDRMQIRSFVITWPSIL